MEAPSLENISTHLNSTGLQQLARFSTLTHTIVGFYLLVLAAVAIPLNTSIIVLFGKTKSLRTPMNLLFVSLATSDLTVSVCAFFQGMGAMGRWYLAHNDVVCKIYGTAVFLAGEASLAALMVVAVERYLTVIRPFNIGGLTYTRTFGAIAYTWVFSAVWAIGPLIGWSNYIPEGLGTWCSVDFRPTTASNVSYFLLLFILSYIIPVFLILFSYTSVWMKVREMAKAASATESSEKAQVAVAKMSCLMVTFFVIAWTPYALLGLFAAFGPPGLVTNTHATLPSLFAKSSCIYNPIIYIGMNKAFRHGFFMMVLGRDPFKAKDTEVTSGGQVTVATNQVAPVS